MERKQPTLATKSNSEGRVTVKRETSTIARGRRGVGREERNDSNPRHYEDFNRLLGGMARSSE